MHLKYIHGLYAFSTKLYTNFTKCFPWLAVYQVHDRSNIATLYVSNG